MMPQYQPFIAAVDDIRFRQAAQSVHLPDALARMQQPAAPATPVVDLRIAEAVAAERVDVYLEPIQTLSDRKPQHFEISVRFRDAEGIEIAQDELARIARASGLGASVDAVKLPRVARVAQRVQSRGRPADVLTTLFGDSLADQNFLEQFATEFAAEVPGRIVLSFAQADVRGFGRVHWETLATMAEIGLKFAIEDVTDLDMDFEALKVCNFKFVKLDAQVFLDGLPAAGGSIPSEDICRHFSSLGMALVVGSIDDEWLLAQIHGFGAVFGQGPLFGAPRPVRQDVLSSVRAA
jgi:cyclic-di-GMP phosphodiesterase, flagellum assembly factor TipF